MVSVDVKHHAYLLMLSLYPTHCPVKSTPLREACASTGNGVCICLKFRKNALFQAPVAVVVATEVFFFFFFDGSVVVPTL